MAKLRKHKRIPWGKEHKGMREWSVSDSGGKCIDCGAKRGELHGRKCESEECPVCGEQLLSCGHGEQIWGPRKPRYEDKLGNLVFGKRGKKVWQA